MLPPLDAAFLPKMDSSERSLDFLGGSKDHRYREAERFKYAPAPFERAAVSLIPGFKEHVSALDVGLHAS